MFLFRKKKENPEIKIDAGKAEVKKAAAPPVKVVDKSAKAARNDKPAKGTPVKVVVPGDALNNGEALKNPDEIADSLLVKVDPNPEIETAVDDAVVAAVLKPIVAPEAAPAKSEPVQDKPAAKAENSPIVNTAAPAAALPVVSAEVKTAPPIAASPAETPKVDPAKAVDSAEKKAADASKKSEAEDKGNLFSNLFGKADVEEETHLDRLIKSLPDISIEEVINEADEVKSLMSEWFQSQKK